MEQFWIDVLAGVVAGLASSGTVALGFYYAIDRRLRRAEQREARAQLVRDVLREVKLELDHDRAQADVFMEHASATQIPFPLFDVNGWSLLTQADVLSALDADLLEVLVKTYNRLRTANENYRLLHDLVVGQSALLAQGFASLGGEVGAASLKHRQEQFEYLHDRIEELLPVLDDARSHVDATLALPQGSTPRELKASADSS